MSARAEIETTLYRYAQGFDEDDLDLLASCFTEDAEIDSGVGEVSGRAAIRAAYQERRDARTAVGEQPRHVVTNVRIELDGEAAARSSAYYALILTGADGIRIASAGTYTDELVRTDAGWQIARRRSRGDARA